MLGVYISQGESGDPIECCICDTDNDDGYYLNPKDDEEWTFLEHNFGDPGYWAICESCKIKFVKILRRNKISFWVCSKYYDNVPGPQRIDL